MFQEFISSKYSGITCPVNIKLILETGIYGSALGYIVIAPRGQN